MVKPYCDGVDLNCGCPQTWAISEGIGCKLMSSPELVGDMVRAAKERCGKEFSISVKIRIHHDLRYVVTYEKPKAWKTKSYKQLFIGRLFSGLKPWKA